LGFLLTKTLISALIIVAVTEIAKRSAAMGALVASLPLVSVLSMIWFWRDTGDAVRLANYSQATFWYVIPSLPMFLMIPILLRTGISFWLSLSIGIVLTAVLYLLTRTIVARFGLLL
jgi:hypothetical protein